MPTLNWIGKEEVINHDKEVPFKLFREVKSLSVGNNSQNLIIHGDNLEALKALMPYYKGKINCIYIDPPYNTGYEGWTYSDKVNSPKILKWFKEKTSVKADDLTRHDKWLCMIYPRIKLLKELLHEDGVIFINIDDNEQAHLRLALNEIFGEENFESFIWKKKGGAGNTEKIIGNLTEYILCYFKNKRPGIFNYRNLERDYKCKDEIGPYNLAGIEKTNRGVYERKTMRAPIIDPKTGKKFYPKENMRWTIGAKSVKEASERNELYFDYKKKKVYAIKRPEDYEKSENVYYNLLLDVGSLATAKNELQKLGFDRELFDTPKPVDLIKRLLEISTNKDSVILDSFSGSATTGHAVMQLNKEDGGKRKFILIEMEDHVAKDITAERIKRAIKKYDYKEGFEYCELDKPLFDENRQIDKSCSFEQLATYIYFTETRNNINKKKILNNFVGNSENGEIEFYLIFKEIKNNLLTSKFLKKLKKDGKRKIIYADQCLLSDKEMKEYNIQFKQIPYEVEKY